MIAWNDTRESLPAVHDRVQFIVAGHRAWLHGTYQEDGFHSRWFRYAKSDVSRWRQVDEAPSRRHVEVDDPGLHERSEGA